MKEAKAAQKLNDDMKALEKKNPKDPKVKAYKVSQQKKIMKEAEERHQKKLTQCDQCGRIFYFER